MPEFNVTVVVTINQIFEGVEAEDEDKAKELVLQALPSAGTQGNIKVDLVKPNEVDPGSYDSDTWEVEDIEVQSVEEL